jgi:hypothetical protein
MRIAAEGLGNDPFELRFDLVDSLAGRETGAVADSEYVGVDGEGFLAECGVEDDVGGLAADAGQFLQLVPRAGNLAAKPIDQGLAQRNDVLGLGVEQANRLDRFAQTILAEINHLAGSLDALEERTGRDIHARVGRLSRQNDRDEQLVGIPRLQLRGGGRVRFRQTPEEFENVVTLHLRSLSP